MLRGFQNVAFDQYQTSHLLPWSRNPNVPVASLATELIGRKGVKEDIYEYKALATPELDWRVKTKLYHAMMKACPVFYQDQK
ncbi:MAG: hypothetical protein IPJ54_10275 [Saprospiraceae bacterium]|nr:hypothetical protein [Saprospiraceae bacterium]